MHNMHNLITAKIMKNKTSNFYLKKKKSFMNIDNQSFFSEIQKVRELIIQQTSSMKFIKVLQVERIMYQI